MPRLEAAGPTPLLDCKLFDLLQSICPLLVRVVTVFVVCSACFLRCVVMSRHGIVCRVLHTTRINGTMVTTGLPRE